VKISVVKDPGATLVDDRKPTVVIDGSDTLLLSRAEYAIFLESGVERMTLKNIHVVGCWKFGNRLTRFLHFSKYVWKFSK
jgi:hypothetical protein